MQSSETPQRTLETLRDLEGVVGSFVVNDAGDVLAEDVPAYFGESAQNVGPRALRFFEALSMASDSESISHSILHYGTHKMLLRPVRGGLLASIFVSEMNMPALRMALNLVARKLDAARLDQLPASSGVPISSASTSNAAPSILLAAEAEIETPAPEPPPPPLRTQGAPEASPNLRASSRPVFFRGKRIR